MRYSLVHKKLFFAFKVLFSNNERSEAFKTRSQKLDYSAERGRLIKHWFEFPYGWPSVHHY